jgi:hypothetical protein
MSCPKAKPDNILFPIGILMHLFVLIWMPKHED